MIAHFSVPARCPRKTADLLAALIDGDVFSFAPVPGGLIVVARDGSGTAIEVLPETVTHEPGIGDAPEGFVPASPQTMPWEVQVEAQPVAAIRGAVHVALTTTLDRQAVLALCTRTGWRALECDRAGVFKVIELWIDNRFLIEVLTETEAERYRAFLRPDVCVRMFGKAA